MHTSSFRNRSLVVNHITKSFWETPVLCDISLAVNVGDRIGLVGRNGSGKSTLLKILAGVESADSGTTVSNGLALGYLPQEAVVQSECTIGEALDQASDRGFEKQFLRVLDRVGLDQELSTSVAHLSGGELMRLGFARILLRDPDIVLLDEPTNHLDLNGIEWLTKFLSDWRGGFVIISHNRDLLDAVTTSMWELEDGRMAVFGGNYSFYREQKRLAEEARQREVALLEQKIRKTKKQFVHEQERAAHSARAAISDRPDDRDLFKAGFKKDKAERTAGKKKTKIQESIVSLKEDLVSSRQKILPSIRPSILASEASSQRRLIAARNFTCGYGGRIIVTIPELEIRFGDRIAIFGDNGSGKSTIVKALLNDPAVGVDGSIERAEPSRIEYLDQHAAMVDRQKTIWELLVAASPHLSDVDRRNHLARFLFRDTADVKKQTSVLSGGELTRFAIALISIQNIDLLILDEPTNNLDIPAIEEMETALREFTGALIVISHDRAFLRNCGIQGFFSIVNKSLIPVYPET